MRGLDADFYFVLRRMPRHGCFVTDGFLLAFLGPESYLRISRREEHFLTKYEIGGRKLFFGTCDWFVHCLKSTEYGFGVVFDDGLMTCLMA